MLGTNIYGDFLPGDIGMGLTSFEVDIQSSYDVLSSVSDDITSQYYITGQVGNNIVSGYAVLSEVNKDLVSEYEIIDIITLIVSLSTTYHIKNEVTTNCADGYKIHNLCTSDLISSYTLHQLCTVDKTFAYNMAGVLTIDWSSTYAIYMLATNNINTQYSVLSSSYKDISSTYGIYDLAEKDLSDSYIITGQITQDILSAYKIHHLVTKDITDKCEILNTTAPKSFVQQYNILTTAANNISDTYAVRQLLSKDMGSAYYILKIVSDDLTSEYYILSSVNDDIASSYAVTGSILKDFYTTYKIVAIGTSETPDGLITPGNFCIGLNFLPYLVVSAPSHASYPASNLYDYKNPRRVWKSSSPAQADTIILSFSSPSFRYMMINNTNARFVSIKGNSSNSGWDSAPFSTSREVIQDTRVGRYKTVIEFDTAFTYNYMRIMLYYDSTLFQGQAHYIGNLIFPATVIQFKINPQMGYSYEIIDSVRENEFDSGRRERISVTDYRRYKGTMDFDVYSLTNVSDHHAIANITRANPVIFWENDPASVRTGAEAYLCRLNAPITIKQDRHSYVSASYELEEVA